MPDTSHTPRALSVAFIVHFAADVAIAVPLLVAPRWFLGLLGWQAVDPIAARLVAAALFGIGIESLIVRKAPLDRFPHLLELKLIWSSAAIVGFVWSLVEGVHGNPPSVWIFLAIFAGFNALWAWWLRRVRVLLASTAGNR